MVEMDCSLFLHEISHDVFTIGVEMEDREIVPFLQNVGVLFSPNFDDYLEQEQQTPTSQFVDHRRSQPVYDSYESDSELDMLDFQEQTAEPYPLFTKEKYHEEISHLSPSEDVEQHEEEQNSPTGPVYDDYESDSGERQGEEGEEPKRSRRDILSYAHSQSMSNHRLRSISLRQLSTHLCLPKIFSHT
jgi:hypothetical protein